MAKGITTPGVSSTPAPPDLDYEIGYRKPPKATRFKPGQSGNPKGRPKRLMSLAQSLYNALSAKIKIVENGETKKIFAIDAITKSLVVKAI